MEPTKPEPEVSEQKPTQGEPEPREAGVAVPPVAGMRVKTGIRSGGNDKGGTVHRTLR